MRVCAWVAGRVRGVIARPGVCRAVSQHCTAQRPHDISASRLAPWATASVSSTVAPPQAPALLPMNPCHWHPPHALPTADTRPPLPPPAPPPGPLSPAPKQCAPSPHEVGVALDGRPPLEQPRLLVSKDGDALLVALPQAQLPGAVGEKDVGVALAALRARVHISGVWACSKAKPMLRAATHCSGHHPNLTIGIEREAEGWHRPGHMLRC